jgi:hypothetical protein
MILKFIFNILKKKNIIKKIQNIVKNNAAKQSRKSLYLY